MWIGFIQRSVHVNTPEKCTYCRSCCWSSCTQTSVSRLWLHHPPDRLREKSTSNQTWAWALQSLMKVWDQNPPLPFIICSRCSHRISPTKSGARSRNPSFPRSHSSCPLMSNLKKLMLVRLNSPDVQYSHCRTCCLVHLRGSADRESVTNASDPSSKQTAEIMRDSLLEIPQMRCTLEKPLKLSFSAWLTMALLQGVSRGTEHTPASADHRDLCQLTHAQKSAWHTCFRV